MSQKLNYNDVGSVVIGGWNRATEKQKKQFKKQFEANKDYFIDLYNQQINRRVGGEDSLNEIKSSYKNQKITNPQIDTSLRSQLNSNVAENITENKSTNVVSRKKKSTIPSDGYIHVGQGNVTRVLPSDISSDGKSYMLHFPDIYALNDFLERNNLIDTKSRADDFVVTGIRQIPVNEPKSLGTIEANKLKGHTGIDVYTGSVDDTGFRKVYDGLSTYDILLNPDFRGDLQHRYYGNDNPFKSAFNDLANTIYTGAYLAPVGSAIWGLRSLPLLKAGLTLAGGYAGSKIGGNLWNNSEIGQQWNTAFRGAGGSELNQVLYNPGSNIGGVIGSGLGSAVYDAGTNFSPWFTNTMGRMVMTPDGPVMLKPGESYIPQGRLISKQQEPQGISWYQRSGRTGQKAGSGRGSNAGQGNVRQQPNGGKNGTAANRGRHYQGEVTGGRGGITQKAINNPYTDYNETAPYIVTVPTSYSPAPPIVPPVEPPIVENPHYLKEEMSVKDPFIIWFGDQPEGTVQYWPGDSNSMYEPGPRRIIRVKGDPIITQTRVGNARGLVAPDSTRRSITWGQQQDPILYQWEVPGELPTGVTDGSTEYLVGYPK